MQFDLTPAQWSLQGKARELAHGPIAKRAAEIDRTEQYPWDHVGLLKEAGFFGMTVPLDYGGRGASYLDAVLVIEEVAKCCGITGRIVVEANMGAIGAIMKYGSDAQKRLAAGLVLAGDKPAICITEPGAGSAASEMTTRADRRGNGFVINGRKHWITGGGVSRLHLIFARVFDAKGEEEGIGGFIAIRDETRAHAGRVNDGAVDAVIDRAKREQNRAIADVFTAETGASKEAWEQGMRYALICDYLRSIGIPVGNLQLPSQDEALGLQRWASAHITELRRDADAPQPERGAPG